MAASPASDSAKSVFETCTSSTCPAESHPLHFLAGSLVYLMINAVLGSKSQHALRVWIVFLSPGVTQEIPIICSEGSPSTTKILFFDLIAGFIVVAFAAGAETHC